MDLVYRIKLGVGSSDRSLPNEPSSKQQEKEQYLEHMNIFVTRRFKLLSNLIDSKSRIRCLYTSSSNSFDTYKATFQTVLS